MAARPLESIFTARMIIVCQTNMLAMASHSSSRIFARGTVKGTLSITRARPSTGTPSQIDRARKVSGG